MVGQSCGDASVPSACRVSLQGGQEQQSVGFLGTRPLHGGTATGVCRNLSLQVRHAPDGRGKRETGSQVCQHLGHSGQLGSAGRALCLLLPPASLACPAASCLENLRQQHSSGVRATPSLRCIDRRSLKESGLDIRDTY